jgi:acetyl esterase/lipase
MLLSRRRLIALLGSISILPHSFAETSPNAALPNLPEPVTLPLYPGAAPGSEHWTQREVTETMGDNCIIRNVTHPALLAYRPAKPNGTAVIIAPGGGFYFHSMGNEGFDMASKLLLRGFTVFILKYRLIATGEGWNAELDRRLSQPGWEKSLSDEVSNYTLADAQSAIRLVRSRAAEFHIQPTRIGIIGFSAGGYVATRVTLEHSADSRPDFTGCIYGVKPPDIPEQVSDLPPIFMAWANDDNLVPAEKNATPLCKLWKREGVPMEFHLFALGGHGFGSLIHHRPGDRWLDMFMDWINSQVSIA